MFMASSRSRMCGTAAADSSLLTVIRTSSDPARASALTCATVPSISAVSVLVMDCTTIGDLPPMVTVPTFTPREILPEIIPQLYQGDALGHADHHGPGDFVVPGLTVRVEGDPEKSEADHHHGQEAAERPHDGGLPVDHASIQAHDAQIEHDAADGGAAHFPHHGSVGGQHNQFEVVGVQYAHQNTDQKEIEKQRAHANPKAGAGECCSDRLPLRRRAPCRTCRGRACTRAYTRGSARAGTGAR